MATVKKRTARPAKPPATPPSCEPCGGTGEVTTAVRVGRGRRITGDTQTGLCLNCLGTGEAPES